MLLFCRHIRINRPEALRSRGPLLLACNHPNSFLDAVILDALFERPIYSLARGDVFRHPWLNRLLGKLKILPVYRTSEGVENLGENYRTFDTCLELFRRGNIVLIFSEGKCVNEWRLRPLRKGTARLAVRSWEENIPLEVLPVALTYSSFRRFGKNLLLDFGDPIRQVDLEGLATEGQRLVRFNQLLQGQLSRLVPEISRSDLDRQRVLLERPVTPTARWLLAMPAALGWLLHAPLYLPAKNWALRRGGHTDHYDSLLMALLLFTYPVYAGLLTALLWWQTRSPWSLLALLALPATAWAFTRLKGQLDHPPARAAGATGKGRFSPGGGPR